MEGIFMTTTRPYIHTEGGKWRYNEAMASPVKSTVDPEPTSKKEPNHGKTAVKQQRRPVKAISVKGLRGLYGCEMLRIPHWLDNRLTVNCEILATCSSTYSPVSTS
jgi:hypothetical protein